MKLATVKLMAANSGATVHLMVRQGLSRTAFRAGSFEAWLESACGTILGKSRAHATWSDAARKALKLANARGYTVDNRAAVEARIAEGK